MNNIPKRLPIYLPILFAIVLIVGILIGQRINPGAGLKQNFIPIKSHSQYNKLSGIINFIEQDYVDSIQKEKITRDAIEAVIKNLDPHTRYISREDFNAINDPLLGSFEGIGVQFNIIEDTIMILHSIAGGPSEKLGIRSGDRIVMVNDTSIAGIGLTNIGAMRKLKGPSGTKVKISILRKGTPELIDFMITRDIIPTYSLDIAYMVDDSIGYIKLNTFSTTTYTEFRKGLEDLLEKGLSNLIIDLRSNTGGYVQPAVQIADELLSEDKLIVYTKGNNRPKNSSYSTNRGIFEEGKVVILLDEGSASASEILAGAIQDNDRGTIIGRRSFGKGLIQEQLNLPDGSAMRMTTARYYTPTGRSIQKPYTGGDFNEYHSEYYHRFSNGELTSIDSIHFNDSLKYITPEGKTVYGGGGIMPDIFVALETNNPAYYNMLVNRGVLYEFAFEYVDSNRSEFDQFEDFDSYKEFFKITDDFLKSLIAFAEEKDITFNKKQYQESKFEISTLLKAYIANIVFDNDGFYPIFHGIDKTFIKSIEYLTSDN